MHNKTKILKRIADYFYDEYSSKKLIEKVAKSTTFIKVNLGLYMESPVKI